MTEQYATWLADALRKRGLKVEEIPGWRTRGRRGGEKLLGVPKYIIDHHTAGPKTGDRPSLNLVEKGRADLGGPLSNLFLTRSGVWVVVAAGKCNHAGRVRHEDYQNGWTIGIEAEATGVDAWPAEQYQSYVKGVAALLDHLHYKENRTLAHKEICEPAGRKSDPNFGMNEFRALVGRQLDRWAQTDRDAERPPAHAPAFKLGRVLQIEKPLMRGKDVEQVALALKRNGFALKNSRSTRTASGFDGIFGPDMAGAVKAFRTRKGLRSGGEVGPRTTVALGGVWIG